MLQRLCLICCLFLCACAVPGREYTNIPAQRVTVNGSTFDIRIKASQAQAIRINRQYAPRLGPIGARAAYAMEAISGCQVTKLKGDAAVLLGTLRCAGDPTASAQPVRPQGALECYGIDSFDSPATGELITNYDCDWVGD